ncbi:MAG: hypothetical protein JWN53_2311 [Gemmatimonadetes bacterium]|nr:hypothetical protein [Gemmatimonadota bacterium]
MRLFRTFRDDRTLLRRSAAYAEALMAEPAATELEWLSTNATRGDADHARWELRYLRRALGILVAQRDALDDRTPSEALRALASRMQKDPNVDRALRELAERQFNARLSAYRDAFTSRGEGTPALRVAQNLLAFAGGPIRGNDPVVQRGAELVGEYLASSNEALRRTFGLAELPEDVPPSQIAR